MMSNKAMTSRPRRR